MTLADDLERLAQLRSSGALSDFEFEAAKRKLLASDITPAAIATDHLTEIQHQNEVAQLDRQWQINRDKYLVHGRYGSRIPTKGSSVAQGLIIGVFGSIWTIMTLSMMSIGGITGAPLPFIVFFPAFGVFFTLFGIVSAFRSYSKAEEYEAAQRQYEQQRARLLAK